MIVYVGENDFTTEIIPAEYSREDAVRETSFSDGEPGWETPPAGPKRVEFPKNGTMRRFSRTIRAPIGFSPSEIKMYANRRIWLAVLPSGWAIVLENEKKPCFGRGSQLRRGGILRRKIRLGEDIPFLEWGMVCRNALVPVHKPNNNSRPRSQGYTG